MAVVKAPVRQQSYLTEYDKLLAEQLRRMSGSIGPGDIAAESYGGKFPVGTMTAKILGSVLARASDKRAMNREEQSKEAARALLSGRGTDRQPQLLEGGQFEAGEYMTPDGRYVTQLAPVEEGVGETRDQYLARKLRNEQIANRNIEIEDEKALFNQFVQDQPDKASYTSTSVTDGYTGTEKDTLSAMLTGNYRGQDLQPLEPIPEITEGNLLKEGEIKPGIMIAGKDAEPNPNWWERNIKGEIPAYMAETKNELIQLAGYDPLEWTLFERELAKNGGGIEYSFQNISNATLTNGIDSFLTKVGSRTAKDGTIEQFFQDPNNGTWQPMAGTNLTYIPEDKTTKNREQTALDGRKLTAQTWLINNGYIEDAKNDEFVTAMASAFSGDITKENLKTGELYSELPAVYKSLKNIKDDFDVSTITTQGGVDVLKVTNPTKGKILEDKVNALAEKINNEDLATSYTTLTDLQNLIDKYPEDIPGAGYKGSLARNFMLGKDGKKIRALIATVQNRALKERSGAAVTPSEFERFEKEIPTWLSSEDNLRNGLKTLRKILDAKIGTIFATEPSYISEIYMSRPNSLKLKKSNRVNLYQKYKIK